MAESKQYRSKFYWTSAAFLAVVLVTLCFVNVIARQRSGWKVDCTEEQIYSISPATESILGGLQDKIEVEYYVSENLGKFLVTLQRDTVDLFEEFRKLSGGKFEYEVIDPEIEKERFAERMTAEYLKNRADGKELTEPERPMNPMDFFTGRQRPTPEQIREERDELAGAEAKRSKRDRDEVYREILFDQWEEKYELDLAQKGVNPFLVQDRSADSVRQLKVYSSIVVKYLDREPEGIPQHASLEGLEYELAHRIVKVSNTIKPTVAFFDARKPDAPPPNPMQPMQAPPSDYSAVINTLGQLFDVRETKLEEGDAIDDVIADLKRRRAQEKRKLEGEDEPKDDSIDNYRDIQPEDFGLLACLIVAQPDQLEDRQIYEISRAVSMGVKTIFLASPYTMDVSPQGVEQGVPIESLNHGLGEMLRAWGVEFRAKILCSNLCGPVIARQRLPNGIPIQRPVPLTPVVATDSQGINQESGLSARLQALLFPATTGLTLSPKEGIEKTSLAWIAEQTWEVAISPYDRLQGGGGFGQNRTPGMSYVDYQEKMERKDEEFREFLPEPTSVVLAVELRGAFPFQYQGQKVPAWAEKPAEGEELDPHAGIPGFPPMDRDAVPDVPDPTAGESVGGESVGGDASGAAEASGGEAATPTVTVAPPGADAASESEAPVADVTPRPGRVLVLASADMLKDDFVLSSREYELNFVLLQNAVESFGLDQALSEVRRKQQKVQAFKQGSDKDKWWVEALNLAGVPAVVLLLGLVRYVLRRAASVRYERDYLRSHNIG